MSENGVKNFNLFKETCPIVCNKMKNDDSMCGLSGFTQEIKKRKLNTVKLEVFVLNYFYFEPIQISASTFLVLFLLILHRLVK